MTSPGRVNAGRAIEGMKTAPLADDVLDHWRARAGPTARSERTLNVGGDTYLDQLQLTADETDRFLVARSEEPL